MKKAKSIMIQATMSDSGKSFLVAGLLRVLKEDGYLTAPFKSQNMANNSYITKDGLEIGRAQGMQAEAAGIEASVDMNPILIKPNSFMGSQIVLNGEVHGNMRAMDYYKEKKKFLPYIDRAYQNLSDRYDIIVIEGAGSPAEINLKENDIVNMGLAKRVKAPVLLIGDIDRGGVFASIYGTIALLDEDERRLIKGIIINKFRGDIEILRPGIKMIEDLTGIPVLGVVPMADIDIEEEDSLSKKITIQREIKKDKINIAIIRPRHISNFTDFTILERLDGINISYLAKDFQSCLDYDMIILPGTKNTISDLRELKALGLREILYQAREKGIYIMGICGGFQMLGTLLKDEQEMEAGGVEEGFDLLDMETVFEAKKKTNRISGKLVIREGILRGLEDTIRGYEIHMGQSYGQEDVFCRLDDGRTDGYISKDRRVFGTYLHGIFENKDFCIKMFQNLADEKMRVLDISSAYTEYESYKEREFDKLASLVREYLDMKKVYQMIEEGVE